MRCCHVSSSVSSDDRLYALYYTLFVSAKHIYMVLQVELSTTLSGLCTRTLADGIAGSSISRSVYHF